MDPTDHKRRKLLISMNKTITMLISSLVIGGTLLCTLPLLKAQETAASAPAAPAPPPPPSPAGILRAALRDLEQARLKLNRVPHDLEGHQAAALKACDEAIKESKAAMKVIEEKK